MGEGYVQIEGYSTEADANTRCGELIQLGFQALVAQDNVFVFEEPPGDQTRRAGDWFVIAVGRSDLLQGPTG